jgi:hypothetical protein
VSDLFGRQVSVQLGLAGTTGRAFSGLRTTFKVEMSRTSKPNPSTIELYNPSPESIALAQAPGCVVRLLAGYDLPRLIAQGNPVKRGVRLDHRGPDRVLHLEIHDGGQAYAEARLSLSFATATTTRQVFDAAALQLGLPAGAVRLVDKPLPRGFHFDGRVSDLLDRLAVNDASDWFIRDGTVCFVGSKDSTGETALAISNANGNLVGSPAPKEDGSVEVAALLDPAMRPGVPFALTSLEFKGAYVARSVAFDGDTHGQSWYMKVVGVRRG